MNILKNNDKHILPLLPRVISEKTGKKAEKIRFIGGGSFGRVYKTELDSGEVIAVKAYKVQGDQHREASQLEMLSKNTGVNMPKVVFTYEDEETAILAMSFVEGSNVLNPVFLLKSKKEKQLFAEAVIDGMLQWHSLTGEKYGSLSAPEYDTWYDYYKKEKLEPWLKGFGELCENGKLSKKKLQLLEEASEIFLSLPEESKKPVLIHADLNIMNIMADNKSFRLTGFIDPCGSMWADREYDLFQFRNMWGDAYGLYECYKKKQGLSDYADFRVAYYGAMHEVSMRLSVGHTVPLWEDLNFIRLKKEMKKIKEKL